MKDAEMGRQRLAGVPEEGALDDLCVAVDGLATCSSEQKRARRVRSHAENLREAAELREPEDTP